MDEREEIYYYCTKKNRFLKADIINYVLELFNQTGERKLALSVIYSYLQQVLNVSSVNRENLRRFLKANVADLVSLDEVLRIKSKYSPSEEKEALHFSGAFLARVKEIVNNLGIEYVVDILKTDGSTIFNVCELLRHKDASNFIETKLFNEKHNTLGQFISSFNEDELYSVLDSEDDFNELFQLYIDEIKRKKEADKIKEQIKVAISNIHNDNRNLRLSFLLNGELNKELSANSICRVNDLFDLSEEVLSFLASSKHSKMYLKIFDRLKFSISEALRNDFADILVFKTKGGRPINEWERYIDIINKRACGETLAAVGTYFGLTRERVRQIEKKYEREFKNFYSNSKGSISGIIHALANSVHFITIDELKSIFTEYVNIFVYFLKQYEEDDMDYIPELDIFAYQGVLNWYEEVLKLANSLPQSILVSKMEELAQDLTKTLAELSIEIPYSYIHTILVADYKLNGLYYSRSRMSLTQKYDIVLRKYFPDGIKIYEEGDIVRFRECYAKVFDDADKLPENDRAIYGRIAAVAILCDRGKYISKPDKLISDELLKDICDYIDNSNKEIFLMNTIFYVFEDRLVAEGIGNKYYLQGILHELLPNKYFFQRDYVSKAKNISSIYSSVVKFVENAGHPVTKAQLKEEFIGVPEQVMQFALQNENIVCGFSVYIHKNFIVGQSEIVDTLRAVIEELVDDNEIHSSEDLMSILSLMHPEVLTAFEVDGRYVLFSIVEMLFKDEFTLSRPFLAKKGIEIGWQEERIRDWLADKDEVEISELMGYVRDNSFIVNSILVLLNSINDEFLIKDKNTIIRLDLTGMNRYKADYVDEYIDDLIGNNDMIVLRNQNFSLLPRINIIWNSWLVYSVINKWSKRYKVTTTNRQLRFAEPIIYKAEILKA